MRQVLLEMFRYSSNTDSTMGVMLFQGNFECDTLEDEYRMKKVSKETRIPGGLHRLVIKRNLTGLTKKYRKKYDWFKYHIQILCPNFSNVYIHNGLNDDHTAGCPLVGEKESNNVYEAGKLKASKMDKVYKEFYEKVYSILDQYQETDFYIRIVDLDISTPNG